MIAPGTYERCTEVPPFARAYITCRTHRRYSRNPIPTFPVLSPQSTPWLSRCSVTHGSFRPTTNFTAAAAPRNSSTCWFCSGTRREWCAPADEHIPSLPVSLPQVESLAEVFSQGLRGWGANIDVTNCYWSMLLRDGKSHLFRVGWEECMWVFKTLPFGWSYSPLLCQRLLAQLMGKVGLEVAGTVLRLMHYLDDVTNLT